MRILACRLAVAVAFSFSACCLVAPSSANGAVYWDTNGTTLGSGNSGGSWSGSYWNTSSAGGSSGTISTWPSGGDAVFSAGTDGVGSLTITVTSSPVVENLTVAYGNITLTSTGSFALASSATWTANAGTTLVVQPGISTASLLTIGGSGNSTYAGIITGGANLVKSGSALARLSAANAFLGTTTISGGTLDLANGNALQLSTLVAPSPGSLIFDQSVSSRIFNVGSLSGAGNITLQNSASTPTSISLTVGANNNSTTYSGVLSGSGAVTKFGIGSLTLTATNAYTGGTTISGGTLQLGDGNYGDDGKLSASGGIVNNANLAYNLYGNQTYGGAMSGIGNVTLLGVGALTLTGSTTFSGSTSISAGTLNLSHSAALSRSTLVAPTTGTLVFDQSVSSHAFVIGNLSGSGDLALQNSASTPAPISLTVGGNNTTTEYFGVLSGAGSLTFAGNGTLILANTSTYSGLTTVASGALQFGDGTSGNDGLLSGSGGIVNNAAVTFSLYGSEAYGGNISGSGSLTKSGTGLLTLTGTNLYSGGTNITAGTLQLGDGTSGHDCVLSTSGGIINNGSLIANVSGSQTIAAPISGAGDLKKTGDGLLTLTAPNSYTGNTTISAGTLQLGDGTVGHDGSLSGGTGIVNNSALAFKIVGPQTYSGAISGYGFLVKAGSGSLTLSNTNSSYSGGTTVSAGALVVTNTGALPYYSSSPLTVAASGTLALSAGSATWPATAIDSLLAANGGGFAAGSTLGIDTSIANFTYAGAIYGSMGLAKLGSHSLTLTGTSSYTSATNISAGTLQLGDGTSGDDGLLSGTTGISDSGALVYDLYGPQSYSGAILGPGSLTKLGTGTLVLQGSNTLSGVTLINSGTLVLANSAALLKSTLVAPTPSAGTLVFDSGVSNHAFNVGALSGSGNLALQNNAATAIMLGVGGNNTNSVYFGTLSGAGSLTKSGSGLLTLLNSSSFTGGTTISGGTLQLGNGVSGHDGSLVSGGSIADNGTLSFDLFGSQTYSGKISGSGNLLIAAGSVSITSAAALSSTAGNMHIGERSGAMLTLSNSSSISVGGELDVNYQATAGGSTGYLNLQGGTLNVTGPVTIGHARMDSSPFDTCAQVNQTGGTLTSGGTMTIGLLGAAESIYNASAGRLSASSGMVVGNQGNGVLNISGSGNVSISSTAGLAIGENALFATGGTVNLSAGTLAITGDTIIGSGGAGTLIRSGGILSSSGNLVAGGVGTLVLNGSSNSVATYFGGHILHNGTGTLVVVPYNNLFSSGGSEALSFGQSSAMTGGIIGPWAVRETSGTNSSGDYLTLTASGGSYGLGTASYTGTSVLSLTSTTLTSDISAYAVKFGSGSTTTLSDTNTLTLTGGGMILNAATISGSGGITWNTAGMVFAGTSTASTIGVPITGDLGLTKFGPGKLILLGNSLYSLSGNVTVSAGVLSVQNSGALGLGGSASAAFVASGAALELQGNVAVTGVPLTISGSGVSGGGSLRNVQDQNSWAGAVTLDYNAQIGTDAGTLTLNGPIQGGYNLTKTGTGTLALTADSSFGFFGAIAVNQGTLDVSNSGALGSIAGGGNTTIGNSATLAIHGNVTLPQSLVISGSGLGNTGAIVNSRDDNGITGSIQLAGTAQINTVADSLMLSGPIFGGFGLTKTGTGLLALSGVNSFSGPLSVPGGTLSIPWMNNAGSAGPLGSGTSAIALGGSGGTATLDYEGTGDTSNRALSVATSSTAIIQVGDPSANLTLTGAVSGTGSLVMTGPGTLTVGGTETFSGPVFVTQGVLAINPSGSLANSSTISVSPAAALQLTYGSRAQFSSSAAIALNGSSLSFLGNAAISGGESAGTLTLGPGENDISLGITNTGSNVPYLKFAGLAPHSIGASVVIFASSADMLLQSGSNTNGILGDYAIYNGTDFATLTSGTVQAYSGYTTGNLGTLAVSSTTNFEPTGLQTSLTGAVTINSLNLVGATGVSNTAGYTITLASGGLIANTTGGIRGGTLKGSASGELTIYVAKDIAVSSTIADNGGPTALVISGPGTLTLTASNTYTGNTWLNNSALVLIPPVDTTYAGAIHGPGNLTKSGTTTLTLSGTSDFSGTTTITGGGLRVNNLLSPNSEVTLQSSAVLCGSGTVGGDVTVTGGSIAMSSSGSILGAVNVDIGTLTIGKSGTGSYLTTLGGLYVTGGGALVGTSSTSAIIVGNVAYSSSANSTYSGLITGGSSSLDMNSLTGTVLLLTQSNSYGGGTSIEGGTLKLGNGTAAGSGVMTMSGGTLDLGGLASAQLVGLSGSGGTVGTSSGTSTLVVAPSGGASTTFAGSIINGGGLVSLLVNGSGTLVLSGSSSYSGGTTVQSGTLVLESTTAVLGGSNITVGSAGSFAPIVPDAPIPPPLAPVPEPTSLALLLAAAFGAALVALRTRIGGKNRG